MGNQLTSEIVRAAELISAADALIVAAGAGMGVDSGLPDFRGKEGFWNAYPAFRSAGIEFYDIASPAAFESSPRQAWGFYGHRLAMYRATAPHQGFAILNRWTDEMPLGGWVFTSNVDGHFQKAGFDPDRIHECHGSIHHLQCLEPCCDDIWSADQVHPEIDVANCELTSAFPRCPRCGGMARPNILMFGDWGWVGQRSAIQSRRFEHWLPQVQRPVIIEIGAGRAIPSVRSFSQRVVGQFGGRLVRINPDDPQVSSSMDVGLKMQGLPCLQAIDDILSQMKSA
jgi:NAD-dependent SIR2 family protein deacetylase